MRADRMQIPMVSKQMSSGMGALAMISPQPFFHLPMK